MFENILRKLLVIFLSLVTAFSPIEVVAADLSPLTQAILRGDYAKVTKAMYAKASPNSVDPAIQHTPSYRAVAPGCPRYSETTATLAQYDANMVANDPQ